MSIDHNGAARETREARMQLRVSARQDATIREAASSLEVSLTEFVLESAMLRAEQVLADRRHFILDDEQWAAFTELLDRPPVSKPRLAALLAMDTVFTSPS